VLLIGARARGDAHPEAAIELLVVLAELPDRCREKTRMDKIMWRHSIRHETVVTETPIAEQELERGVTPLAARARAEGVRVG
jgi:predicted nucleotidyltransferase